MNKKVFCSQKIFLFIKHLKHYTMKKLNIFIAVISLFFATTSCAKDPMVQGQFQVVPERTYESVVAFPSQLGTVATATTVPVDIDQDGYADRHRNPGTNFYILIEDYTIVDFRVFTGQYDARGNQMTQIIQAIVPKSHLNQMWAYPNRVWGVKYSPVPYGSKRIFNDGRLDPSGAINWTLSSQ